jgi:hypothetical protein
MFFALFLNDHHLSNRWCEYDPGLPSLIATKKQATSGWRRQIHSTYLTAQAIQAAWGS